MNHVLIAEDCKIIRKGISAMIARCQVPINQIIECKKWSGGTGNYPEHAH